MYCVIQEIELKKKNTSGAFKELKVSELRWSSNGEENVTYNYTYGGGRFERPIKKAYKITVHHSYREDGKVKKKQWTLGTMGYYDIATDCYYIGDCCNMEKKADSMGITEDELFRIIAVKIDTLIIQVKKEFQQTEEFKVSQKHKKIINEYLQAKNDFEKIYGSNTYDYCYDIFGELRNKEMLDNIKKQYEAAQEQKRSYYDNFKSNYNSNYDFSSYFNTKQNNYTDKEKDYLKKIYRAAAMKLHPDVIKDDGEGMKFLNNLKEEWGI